MLDVLGVTEDEWAAFAIRTEDIRDAMPHCMCACKCQYPLFSTRSTETHICFSCRSKLHAGSGPIGTDIEVAQ